jgi:hypothetical protein
MLCADSGYRTPLLSTTIAKKGFLSVVTPLAGPTWIYRALLREILLEEACRKPGYFVGTENTKSGEPWLNAAYYFFLAPLQEIRQLTVHEKLNENNTAPRFCSRDLPDPTTATRPF